MRRTTTTLGAAAALLLLASCAATGVASPGERDAPAPTAPAVTSTSSSAVDATVLNGRTFLSTEVSGKDLLVKNSTITLSFEDGQVRFQAGCNTYSGAVTITADTVHATELGGTEMGCSDGQMEQDARLADLLQAGMTWQLDGDTLTLRGDDATITLVDRTVADPDRQLRDTAWLLESLLTGDAASSVPVGVQPSLTFAASATDNPSLARLEFHTGCNTFDGAVSIVDDTDPATMQPLEPLMHTDAGCEGAQLEVEQLMASVFGGPVELAIEADALTVTAADGNGLVFRASPDDPTAPTPDPSVQPEPQPTTSTSRTPTSDPLAGRTFVLTRLFTDAGGIDTRLPDATFTMTFGDGTAEATSQCGTHHYDHVKVGTRDDGRGIAVDLGTPTGPSCELGTDPIGIPSGPLFFGEDPDGTVFLSTGYVGWYFEEDGS